MYLHGRRLLELQKKWRNLRPLQNASAFCNFFSSSSSSSSSSAASIPEDGRKGKTFTVSYLVDSLGLNTKLAESISKKVSFEEKGNPDSVLNLFKSHGFTVSQISTIVTNHPRLLILDSNKSVGPKLRFLQSSGTSSSELTEIVSKVPKILCMKENKTVARYYDFVKVIIEADKSSKFEKLCHSLSQGSKQENKIRNVLVLRELGMPQKLLLPLLVSDHQPVCGKERFEESVKKIVEMGFDPKTPRFVHALNVVYRISDKTVEEKVNSYKRLGFDEGDVWEMFKKWPSSLTYSEKKINRKFETLTKCGLEKHEILSMFLNCPQCIATSEQKVANSIDSLLGLGFSIDEFAAVAKCYPQILSSSVELVKSKIEFVVKKMNWPVKAVVSNPSVLGYSLEKRTVPRCNVINVLMSKGLLGSKIPPMGSVLVCTDEVFLKRYVEKHDDLELVTELMALFNEKRLKTDKVSELSKRVS